MNTEFYTAPGRFKTYLVWRNAMHGVVPAQVTSGKHDEERSPVTELFDKLSQRDIPFIPDILL